MAKTRLSSLGRTLSARAVAAVVARLRLLDGNGELLAELPVIADGGVKDGRAALRFADSLGQRMGDPKLGQCLTADGDVVFDVDVGPVVAKGKTGAVLQLDPWRVFSHGTVSVPELIYEQPE